MVWDSAPGWTVVGTVVAVVQGLIPAASLGLTKLVVLLCGVVDRVASNNPVWTYNTVLNVFRCECGLVQQLHILPAKIQGETVCRGGG